MVTSKVIWRLFFFSFIMLNAAFEGSEICMLYRKWMILQDETSWHRWLGKILWDLKAPPKEKGVNNKERKETSQAERLYSFNQVWKQKRNLHNACFVSVKSKHSLWTHVDESILMWILEQDCYHVPLNCPFVRIICAYQILLLREFVFAMSSRDSATIYSGASNDVMVEDGDLSASRT